MCAPSLKKTVKACYETSEGSMVTIPVEVSLFEHYVTQRKNVAVDVGVNWLGAKSRWTCYLNADMSLNEIKNWNGNKHEDPIYVAEVFKAIRIVIRESDVKSLPVKNWNNVRNGIKSESPKPVTKESSQTELSLDQQNLINAAIANV